MKKSFFKNLNSLQLSTICNWHLRVWNLSDESIKYDPNKAEILDQFQWKIQNALISAEQLALNVEEFKKQWKGKAAAFMNSVQSQIHRFCAAYTHVSASAVVSDQKFSIRKCQCIY